MIEKKFYFLVFFTFHFLFINAMEPQEDPTDKTKKKLDYFFMPCTALLEINKVKSGNSTLSEKQTEQEWTEAKQEEKAVSNKYDFIKFNTEDGSELLVGSEFLELSVDNKEELNRNRRIRLQDLNGEQLSTIAKLLESIKNLNRSIDGSFLFGQLESKVRDTLRSNISIKGLGALFAASNNMGAQSLVNVLGYLLAEKLFCIAGCTLHNLSTCLTNANLNFDERLKKYLRKHLILISLDKKELTVGDYFLMKGMPISVTYKLNLSGRQITSISGIQAIPNRTELIEINLSQNFILMDPLSDTSLTESPLRVYNNLKILNLQNNKIKNVSKQFKGLYKLIELVLSYNEIDDNISENAFDDLTNLQKLWLDFNRFKRPPALLLNKLTALETLNMQDQKNSEGTPQLETLPQFHTLVSLKWCCLVNNKLRSDNIYLTQFMNLYNLKNLLIKDNYLSGSEVDFRTNFSIPNRVDIIWTPQSNDHSATCLAS